MNPLGIETARALLDYSGGTSPNEMWEKQLEGAVALYNLLQRQKVAYLADEVGMGKTYVALGVASFFRHFQPGWRVLYIAPRENLQLKWKKELLNFTRHNWRVVDNRVKTFADAPAYGVSLCQNLLDLAHQSALYAQRDFIVRLTSFSFPLGSETRQWQAKRDELLREIPWLDRTQFDLRNKEVFKQNYARGINAALPHFDLLILDEGHNLKHGLSPHVAARNRLLANVLGTAPNDNPNAFPQYSRRFDRALILSATPLESDYRELWNQLNLLGEGAAWRALVEGEDDSENQAHKLETTRRFMIRRLTGLNINGKLHTKNMYRREWRQGGVENFDDPLKIQDDRQRLVVALVQKKVAEIVGSERFSNSFQIGMLASFESFLETAKVKEREAEGASNFDDAAQTDTEIEREGVDRRSINKLAHSYERLFNNTLPHPKMDSVSDSLKTSFETGEKALVFVRRIASVRELSEKLNRAYDKHLLAYLQPRLPETSWTQVQAAYERYLAERLERNKRVNAPVEPKIPDSQEEATIVSEDDEGDNSTFFAWFFRGDRTLGLLSGGTFRKNRFDGERATLSTFFDENYITRLIGQTVEPVETLAQSTALSASEFEIRLRRDAYNLFAGASDAKDFARVRVFRAYQEAALGFLAEHAQDDTLRERARIMRQERFGMHVAENVEPPPNFAAPQDHLTTKTFFTELRLCPALAAVLLPNETGSDFRATFRREELRRELIAVVARLGHAYIDLWLTAVAPLENLDLGQQEREGGERLIREFLDLLESQQSTPGLNAYYELSQVAQNFDLVLAVNFPDATEKPIAELGKYFSRTLGRQSPVAGMTGNSKNQRVIAQFRMPGYPLVLVTTDVLQEGEDLHTFCKRVLHYGISWMPSALEQRTGRVDRIHSLAHRHLDQQNGVTPDQFLQVYFPHLRDTVERVQVERVYERMNRFLRMLHRSFGEQEAQSSRIYLGREFIDRPPDVAPIGEPLQTNFEIEPALLHRDLPVVAIDLSEAQASMDYFQKMIQELEAYAPIKWAPADESWSRVGTVWIEPGFPVEDIKAVSARTRQQPFRLSFRQAQSVPRLLLHCTSPLGHLQYNEGLDYQALNEGFRRHGYGKLTMVEDDKAKTIELSLDASILFSPNHTQPSEVIELLLRTTQAADHLEQEIFRTDLPLENVQGQLKGESRDDSH